MYKFTQETSTIAINNFFYHTKFLKRFSHKKINIEFEYLMIKACEEEK